MNYIPEQSYLVFFLEGNPLRTNKRETIEWLKFTLEGLGDEPWLCLHNQRFCPMFDLVLFWPQRHIPVLLLRG